MINVAVLWIIDEQGRLLLAQRAHHKAQDPGVWGPTVTGKLEVGESFDQALLREVEEEIALKPDKYQPKFLLEVDYVHPDGELRKFGIYYTVLPSSISDELHIDENEVAGIDWFSVEEVTEKMKSNPKELVPSANAVWTGTFEALKKTDVIH